MGLPGWASTRKVKQIWILLKQETVSGSGISWTICESAPRSRQITTPAPHHSSFFTGLIPSLLPNQQHKSTEGNSLTDCCWENQTPIKPYLHSQYLNTKHIMQMQQCYLTANFTLSATDSLTWTKNFLISLIYTNFAHEPEWHSETFKNAPARLNVSCHHNQFLLDNHDDDQITIK